MRRRRRRESHPAPASAIGVDTGGTFTDFVAAVGGRLIAFKLASTPRAPERAVIRGLERAGAARSTRVRHGSTVATNTLLERKGARVALVTNAGFEDLIEIARQDRPDLYALAPSRPEPLVPARRRIGVRARRDERGRPVVPLRRTEIGRAVARTRGAKPEAVAVGLLHSYAAPADERRLGQALGALGLPVTLSSELCPEFREYERFATTVVNAYLRPRVGRYVAALAAACGPRLEIVLSHGGGAAAARAALEPVRQLLSGPAAGLWAAFEAGTRSGFTRLLTLDVGGTSTDVAFAPGRLPRRRAREIAGFPILLPLLDVHSVGAGGGSIAELDAGGLLTVGPRSAGADPGPACYGRGGPATVTDALVVLGRLPAIALGGTITLDPPRARAALAALASRLGVRSAEAAAEAVLSVADARMEAALRRVSIERGDDPRDAALVAFGGAGGLHACALAEALGAAAVVFPPHAGVLSALGALLGPERHERSRTVLCRAADRARLEREMAQLELGVARAFRGARRPALAREALARYAGQSHELDVAFGSGLERRFHAEHRRRFGFAREQAEVEVVTLEVRGSRDVMRRAARTGPAGTREPARRHQARVGGRRRDVPLWRFEALRPGVALRGPGIVLQSGATLWVGPGWNGLVHKSGALVLRRGVRP